MRWLIGASPLLLCFVSFLCPASNATVLQESSPAAETEDDPFGLRADVRFQPPKDLNGYFPFTVPDSLEQWQAQRGKMLQRMKFALGLNPAPEIQVIEPVLHGTKEFDDYRITKVYFQSLPGFYVTGSLYRPLDNGQESLAPGVLCPHGHWNQGRFLKSTDQEVAQAFESGAETLECAARSPLQARCVNLARMGCVVFHYDMIGYADSQQIPHSVAHGFATQRLKLSLPEQAGLFSPTAELNNVSVMALQTINSIASLDFLASLPGVDPQRLAVTGASGGGTQSFILGALDPRLAVSFPAVMVGTAMQGGCTCENCSNLRTLQGNVAFAALFAPRPLGMTAADDWTVELESKGFPQLQRLYQMYGYPDRVHLTSRTEFPHNYNQVGRTAMYRWLGQHFQLPLLPEAEFPLQSAADLSVWRVDGEVPEASAKVLNELTGDATVLPTPVNGPTFERQLLKYWLANRKVETPEAFEKVWREVYFPETAFSSASENRFQWKRLPTSSSSGQAVQRWSLKDQNCQTVNPVRVLMAGPEQSDRPSLQGRQVTIYLGNSLEDLRGPGGDLALWIAKSMKPDQVLVQVDLWGQGGYGQAGYDPLAIWDKTSREFAGYVYGYNFPAAIHRSHDVLRILQAISQLKPAEVHLLASGDGAVAATLSAPLWSSDEMKTSLPASCEVQLDGFRFKDIQTLLAPNFVPGALAYGDVPFYWWSMQKELQLKLKIRDRQFGDWRSQGEAIMHTVELTSSLGR